MTPGLREDLVALRWPELARDLRSALLVASRPPTPENIASVRSLLTRIEDTATDVAALIATTEGDRA